MSEPTYEVVMVLPCQLLADLHERWAYRPFGDVVVHALRLLVVWHDLALLPVDDE
jgi:hypothetical protein